MGSSFKRQLLINDAVMTRTPDMLQPFSKMQMLLNNYVTTGFSPVALLNTISKTKLRKDSDDIAQQPSIEQSISKKQTLKDYDDKLIAAILQKSHLEKQLLKRMASLIADNNELRKKYRALEDSFNGLSIELQTYKELIEKNKVEQEASKEAYQQTRYDTVTIMFVEILNITSLSDNAYANATEYLEMIDDLILRFHNIADKYNLVKLHSIGGHFVCAGGLPDKNMTNPITVTLAALDLLHTVQTEIHNNANEPVWTLSIGIHTGAVTALVDRSTNQNYYELKGDSVNEASRIIAVGKKNKVTISATTYELIKDLFDCKYALAMPVKNHANLDLFTVTGLKQEFSTNGHGIYPNEHFRTQLLHIQFGDLQEYILDWMEKELPPQLYYHNVKHTIDVVTQSELLGWAEELNDSQLLIIKTAALFHDMGHIICYANHEDRSVDFAREILPKYNYLPKEIEEICRIIMATKQPPKPSDLLECIICDADLDYLGRADFVPISNTLFAELTENNKFVMTINDWNKMQLKFISSHQYFTKTGLRLREVNKQEQIKRIKKLISD